MAFFSQYQETPLASHIQSLDDNELLEFWEETQVFTKFLENLASKEFVIFDYEEVILQELQYRFSNKYFSA